MTADDKVEFMKLLGELLGAYDKRATPETLGGYWEVLKSMPVGDFRHVIATAYDRLRTAVTTGDGVARMPTAGALWGFHRERMASQKAAGQPQTQARDWYGDEWNIAANQLLLRQVSQTDWRKVSDTDSVSRALYRQALTWADAMRDSRKAGENIDGKSLWKRLVVGLTTEAVPF